jgi:hypothetical protein
MQVDRKESFEGYSEKIVDKILALPRLSREVKNGLIRDITYAFANGYLLAKENDLSQKDFESIIWKLNTGVTN